MSKILTALFFFIFSAISAQVGNMQFISNYNPNEFSNDVWGYVDSDGIEYAIMGTRTRTLIFSLENPSNPELIKEITSSASTWRDMKSYEDHVYAIQDGVNDGLLVMDMSQPNVDIPFSFIKPEITRNDQIELLGGCHNLYIDESTGLLFLAGCNQGTSGVIIMDLKENKEEPKVIGLETRNYAHDVYAKGDRMYASEINAGQLGIYDISNPSNPILLGSTRTSGDFTHNAWPSDDQNFIFTTDEVGNGTIDAYDISDLDFIEQIDRFRPNKTANTGLVVHNTHYLNGYLITSWYDDGVIITDASRPHNMIEVGNYDTFPQNGGGSSGCWGAYPYLPSGLVLASDMSTGLYVLQPTYVKACYLEGVVTNIETGSAINNVKVEILEGTASTDQTNALGEFATGQLRPGTFEVLFSHPEYNNLKMEVSLENGKLTFLDIQMTKSKRVTISGMVINKLSGEAIEDAQIIIKNNDSKLPGKTNSDGVFTTEVYEGTYNIFAGKWGQSNEVVMDQEIKSDNTFLIELSNKYQDDFVLDLGWKAAGDASTGQWVRDKPIPTFLDGSPSNPGEDIEGDLGDECFVTGNGSGSVGTFDIDGGASILTSPLMDLTSYSDPIIEYSIWFFNSGGDGFPNDTVTVSLHNGIETLVLESLTDDTEQAGHWRERRSIPIAGLIELTDQMSLSVRAVDVGEGHISEAAFDAFAVVEGTSNAAEDFEDISSALMNIFPNPVSDILNINFKDQIKAGSYLSLYNLQGIEIDRKIITGTYAKWQLNVPEGVYFMHLVQDNRLVNSARIVKVSK